MEGNGYNRSIKVNASNKPNSSIGKTFVKVIVI